MKWLVLIILALPACAASGNESTVCYQAETSKFCAVGQAPVICTPATNWKEPLPEAVIFTGACANPIESGQDTIICCPPSSVQSGGAS